MLFLVGWWNSSMFHDTVILSSAFIVLENLWMIWLWDKFLKLICLFFLLFAALVGGVALGLANPTPGCIADKFYLSKFSSFGIFVISGKFVLFYYLFSFYYEGEPEGAGLETSVRASSVECSASATGCYSLKLWNVFLYAYPSQDWHCVLMKLVPLLKLGKLDYLG